MKIIKNYFNQKFDQFNIKKQNIINTYSPEQIQSFFNKEK